MAEARCELEWSQTAEVWALIANVNRDPKKKPTPFKASDINPFAKAKGGRGKKGVPLTKETFFGPFKNAFEKK